MTISKTQTRYIRLLQSELTQHLLTGVAIFLIIFSFFSIQAWYESEYLNQENIPSWTGFLDNLENFPRIRQFVYVFSEALIYTLVMGVPVYFNYFFIYRNRWYRRMLSRFMNEETARNWELYFFLIISSLVALAFTFPVYFFLRENLTIIEFRIWYHTMVVIFLMTIITTAVSHQKERNEQLRAFERKERQEAIDRRKDAERELQFLKKQIRPHFLFNTLQNLQILAKKKSDELPDLLLELATLMRYLIYRTNAKMVMLQDELDFIQSYINLAKVQFRGTNVLEYNLQGTLDREYQIAPMIILNIIENCFKHCNPTPTGEKVISITVEIQDGMLDLRTKNTFKKNVVNEKDISENDKNGGLGLASARRYLDYMYPEQYTWTTAEEGHWYRSHLRIPLK